ncbi:thiol:disulfide interchange protein DsbA/DsbL [Vibrio hannami]|uniref:thiol:disulfide interchange protein DsbA/DsbL n=1 Tax=Vibrio hannami TaxID=2717094 RepID=UPI003EBAEC97
MKKIITLVSTILLSFAVNAAKFEEGKHYQELSTPPSSKPIVTEYFSFYCPHCKSFEPLMNQLKGSLIDGAKFQKAHVSFMGGGMGTSMAKAYATMIALKVEDKMIPVMFRQIQDLKQAPKNDAELRQIFVDNGVDGAKFDAAFNGFAVQSMQRRFDKGFKDAGLRGVPGVVVNNRYLLTPDGSISSTKEYIELVNFLLQK